jgi:maltooligosyltrehalose trehalohydrolase
MPRLGAIPVDDRTVEFRVWAPGAHSVAVRTRSTKRPLGEEDDGTWSTHAAARDGDDYVFVLDGVRAFSDPCSRFQPEGVRGPSRVVETRQFDIAPGPEHALDEAPSRAKERSTRRSRA